MYYVWKRHALYIGEQDSIGLGPQMPLNRVDSRHAPKPGDCYHRQLLACETFDEAADFYNLYKVTEVAAAALAKEEDVPQF